MNWNTYKCKIVKTKSSHAVIIAEGISAERATAGVARYQNHESFQLPDSSSLNCDALHIWGQASIWVKEKEKDQEQVRFFHLLWA